MCIKYCDGFIIMYSIDDISTFNCILKYKKLLERIQERDSIPILLVGNKLDKDEMRQVTVKNAQQFALNIRAGHLETSVTKGTNVELALHEITAMIAEYKDSKIQKKKEIQKKKVTRFSPLLRRVRSSSLSSLFSPGRTSSISKIVLSEDLSLLDGEKDYFLPGLFVYFC